jgi:hypothetical protein
MFHLIITCDYELPAGGKGDVRRHMIEPTMKLFRVCEQHGAKLTIMAEVGELWAFEKAENAGFKKHIGYDSAHLIRQQLREAVQRGHDVQLHLHPQWIHARWRETAWELDYKHYKLTDFEDDQMLALLRRGKEYLETMLRPYCGDYECVGIRAGHWNTQPSHRYLTALRNAGIRSDTSVFKWGYRCDGAADFDYRNAFSNVLAWYARMDDINRASPQPTILEVPIATESVRYLRMLTPRRLWLGMRFLREDVETYRAINEVKGMQTRPQRLALRLGQLFQRYPRKLDFCKLTAREISSCLDALIKQCRNHHDRLPTPLVMIGHSKEIPNPRELRVALERAAKRHAGELLFSTYRDFVEDYIATVAREFGPKAQ